MNPLTVFVPAPDTFAARSRRPDRVNTVTSVAAR